MSEWFEVVCDDGITRTFRRDRVWSVECDTEGFAFDNEQVTDPGVSIVFERFRAGIEKDYLLSWHVQPDDGETVEECYERIVLLICGTVDKPEYGGLMAGIPRSRELDGMLATNNVKGLAAYLLTHHNNPPTRDPDDPPDRPTP